MAAVVKKQQLWELFHQPSRSPSILSHASDWTSFDISSPSRSWSSQKSPPKLVLISDFYPAFDLSHVTMASNELTLVGRGTFGSAYVATMDDGQRFVVKRLIKSEGISEMDFKRNMEIVGDVKHENVVALRAYYSSPDDERLMLYDYYRNGSVYSLLHAHVPGGSAAVDLVKLVNSVKTKERATKVFDPDLLKNPSISEQMIKMLQIGIRCVAKSAKDRPKIFEVVKLLEEIVMLSPVSRSLGSASQEGELVFLEDGNHIFELEHLLMASYEVLGKGSFGTCYKTTLDNGDIYVVKRLRKVTAAFKDFQQHMEVFGRMNHINVGGLKAYFYTRDDKFLVYDYCDQGSLSTLLPGTYLEWESRVRIVLGAARGIAHIHGQDGRKLVLGNIKPSNILLNEQNCSIGFDAGLAELMNPVRLSCIPSPIYCAPEASSGKMSQASDVYSFGVVLLEFVVSERSASLHLGDCCDGAAASLAEWIRSVDMSEWTAQVLDVENLRGGNEEMVHLLQIAMDCVSIVPENRPTIFEVVKVLEEISGEVEPEIVLEDAWGESSMQSRLECLLEDLIDTCV